MLKLEATDTALVGDYTVTIVVNAAGAGGGDALMVTGNAAPGANDVPVKNQLEALGYTVTIKTAATVTAADTNGKDVVVITSTFTPSDLGTKLKSISVPIVQFEPFVYDENEYTPNQAGKRGQTSAEHTQVVIADPCPARVFGRAWSCGVFVFVDEAVASGGSQHGDRCRRSVGRLLGWHRWPLFE